jgi:tetratricopeptide (TPR) repeat protein
MADDMAAVSRDAYNLAVYNLASGDTDKAAGLNTESRIACRSSGRSEASTYLLQAELSRLVRDFDAAAELVKHAVTLIDKKDRETKLEAAVMSAAINLDAGDIESAVSDLKSADKLNKKQKNPLYSAAITGLRGGIALREGRQKEAAGLFAAQADYLRKTGDFDSMAGALRQAADIYSNLDMHVSAAEYYYRVASSLAARDMQKQAAENLDLAEKSARSAGDKLMLNRIRQMRANKINK